MRERLIGEKFAGTPRKCRDGVFAGMAEPAWAERPAGPKKAAAIPATSRPEACPETPSPQRAVLFRHCCGEFSEFAAFAS